MNEIIKSYGESWQELKEKASLLVRSGFLPMAVNTPEKAIAISLAGKELGIGMMEAFRSIYIIQGKPSVSPQLMLALANRTGEMEDIVIDSKPDKCTVTITRKGRKPHIEVFGIPEATKLGLMAKENYSKQAGTMFKWRALAANLRVTFPDVLLGLYTPEELGADVKIIDEGAMEVEMPKEAPQLSQQTAENNQPQPKPDILEIKSIVFDAVGRVGKEKGTPYWLIYDFQKIAYSTFDKKTYEFAKKAFDEKMLCVFRFNSKGRFNNLIELLEVKVTPEPSEDMVGDAQEPVDAEIVGE